MRRIRINVGCHNVRLDFVGERTGSGGGAVDRIQHVKQFTDFVAFTQNTVGDERPYRSVGILAAIFSHPRQIPFDITGIEGSFFKWWSKQ